MLSRILARMNVTPPDPGLAMQLAKSATYSPKHGGFVRARDVTGTEEIRYLYPEAGAWVATCHPERRVSVEAFAILRDGKPSRIVERSIEMSDGSRYFLVDDGFEAVAVPA